MEFFALVPDIYNKYYYKRFRKAFISLQLPPAAPERYSYHDKCQSMV